MKQDAIEGNHAMTRRFSNALLLLAILTALVLVVGLYAVNSFSFRAPPTPEPVLMEAELTNKAETMQVKSVDAGIDEGSNSHALPYLEVQSMHPEVYLGWVIKRGGILVLTQGFKPVATLNTSFATQPIAVDFKMPGSARNVTQELNNLLGELPANASMALLIWPVGLDRRLEQAVRQLPVSRQASRLRATYLIRGDQLELKVYQAFIGGEWMPTHINITL